MIEWLKLLTRAVNPISEILLFESFNVSIRGACSRAFATADMYLSPNFCPEILISVD